MTASEDTKWMYPFPNAADFPFNFTEALRESRKDNGGLVSFSQNNQPRIAIVGAGAAGLAAAYELYRGGAGGIDIYEASDRIGGRLWSVPVPCQKTMYELGAMRIPTFSQADNQNDAVDERCLSVAGFYQEKFKIKSKPFPNPGSAAAVETGIFINDGYGPSPEEKSSPEMLVWTRPSSKRPPPPHAELEKVDKRWRCFRERMRAGFKKAIAANPENQWNAWAEHWREIVKVYEALDFADLIHRDCVNVNTGGDYGGLGMSEKEAQLFYVIGAGDGGWGPFFNVSALYVIRTMVFGFGDGHQLIEGIDESKLSDIPANLECPRSTNEVMMPRPHFRGVQSFAEALFYLSEDKFKALPEDNSTSLFDANNVRLFLKSPVEKIKRDGDNKVKIWAQNFPKEEVYDAVLLTGSTWAIHTGIRFENFEPRHWPFKLRQSLYTAHWITSCKVFVPLKARLKKVPPLVMTDRFIQGVYSYNVGEDPGVLLVSYTWEDDATKLLNIPKKELIQKCVQEFVEIATASGMENPLNVIADNYEREGLVIRWSREPGYAGCAKLYRERSIEENDLVLRYNQDYAKDSRLYLAGDAYGVESGWLDCALRSALDAVIHLGRNLGHTPEWLKPYFNRYKRVRWQVPSHPDRVKAQSMCKLV